MSAEAEGVRYQRHAYCVQAPVLPQRAWPVVFHFHLRCTNSAALHSEIQRDRWAFQRSGQYLSVVLSIGEASTKCQHPADQNLPWSRRDRGQITLQLAVKQHMKTEKKFIWQPFRRGPELRTHTHTLSHTHTRAPTYTRCLSTATAHSTRGSVTFRMCQTLIFWPSCPDIDMDHMVWVCVFAPVCPGASRAPSHQ